MIRREISAFVRTILGLPHEHVWQPTGRADRWPEGGDRQERCALCGAIRWVR